MKMSDRAVVFGVLVVVLAIGFYMVLLAPKRQKAGDLNDQITQLNASIEQQQSVASYAEQARKDFPRYYGRVVVLGKAVPEQADTASMLVQLNSVSERNHLDFRAIELGGDSGAAGTGSSGAATAAPPATAAPAAPAGTSTTSTTPSASTSSVNSTGGGATSGAAPTATASDTPVPATEASAAALPIGAVVGPAGFPTLPYTLKVKGGFFDIANFIGGIDDLVKPTDDGVRVAPDGRLFTVDGFAMDGGEPGGSPVLKASFAVTTYATPADQGVTLGASPSAPSPVSPGAAQAQPASAVVAK
jgi:Tfp pilus assembly protein PilO